MDNPANKRLSSPYPGLRPFRENETHLFFGREQKIEEMLAKLEEHRFLAVIGSSGCGKSSMVRAGMLPALKEGFLSGAGQHWRVAIMHPGESPYDQLSKELLTASALAPERGGGPEAAGILQATLRRGPLGLVDAINDSNLPAETSFLLVVDQFEEIFRYRRQAKHPEDADAFVRLMLSTVESQLGMAAGSIPASHFVIMTMRSDYIGDCSLFSGLPEAINRGLFLTPRLNRREYQTAIVEPARVVGGSVSSALANRLLNDVRAEPDQLPVLQHALMRMWTQTGAPPPESEAAGSATGIALDMDAYEAVGGLSKALSNHADEALADLDKSQKKLAEVMFRCLCERGKDGREIRRPARLGDIAAVADVPWEALKPVVECFRRADRSFIMPPVPVALDGDTFLDISHESLIRQWDTLNRWVRSEADYAETYQRLTKAADRWNKGQGEPWRGVDLELALNWKKEARPTAAWATRYGGEFKLTIDFLQNSQDESEKKALEEEARVRKELRRTKQLAKAQAKAMRRSRDVALVSIVAFIVAALLAGSAWLHYEESAALRAYDVVREAAKRAELESDKAPRLGLLIAADALRSILESSRHGTLPGSSSTDRPMWMQPSSMIHALRTTFRPLALKGINIILHRQTPEVEEMLPSATDTFRQALRRIGQLPLSESPLEHKKDITSIALNQEGDRIASAGKDGVLILWESNHFRPIFRYEGHKNEAREKRIKKADINMVVFNRDGTSLATAAKDHTARLFNYERTPGAERLIHINTITHDDEVQAVAFSDDGRFVATASKDGISKLWDRELQQLHTLEGHGDTIYAIAFSPNNRHLATASKDQTIKIWDTATGDLVNTISVKSGEAYTVTYSKDGNLLACGTKEDIRVYDSKFKSDEEPTYQLKALVKTDGSAYNLALDHKSGRLVAAVGKKIRLWRIDQYARSITSRDPSSIRRRLVPISTIPLDSFDQQRASTVFSEDKNRSLSHLTRITTLAFSPGGERLVSADESGMIKVWMSGLFTNLKGAAGAVYTAAFSSDGRYVFAAGRDRRIRRWDATRSEELPILVGHTDGVRAVSFIRGKSTRIATASNDGSIGIWQQPKLEEKAPWNFEDRPLSLDQSTIYQFNRDGNRLAIAGRDGQVTIWDVENNSKLQTLNANASAVSALCFNFSGDRLAAAAIDRTTSNPRHTAYVWEVATGELLQEFPGHSDRIVDIAFDRQRQRLATASWDHTAKVWDIATGSLLKTIKGNNRLYSIAFAPDGNHLAMGEAKGTATIWELRKQSATPSTTSKGHEEAIVDLAFSPDGRQLITASEDGTARLWETTSGKPISVFNPQAGPIHNICFRPDGQRLAIACGDGIVALYLVQPKALIAEENGLINEPIKLKECQSLELLALPSCKPLLKIGNMLERVEKREVGSTESMKLFSEILAWTHRPEDFLKGLNLDPSLAANPGEAAKQWLTRELKAIASGQAYKRDVEGFKLSLETLKKLNPSVSIVDMEKQAARSFTQNALKMARNGDLEEAEVNYRQAKEFNPDLKFDPEEKARDETSMALVQEAERLARQKQLENALAKLHEAEKLNPEVIIDSRILANICWEGVLQDKADLVLESCERSIQNDPNHGGRRDSRGVARAMTGDKDGAIDDFKAYVDWAPGQGRPQARIDRRNRWIEQLQKGVNPFDGSNRARELAELKVE